MAGAFGDDYGLNYHDDEDLEDQEEQDSLQEEIVQQTQIETGANKKVVANKMNKLSNNIKTRFLPIMSQEEKRLIQTANKNKMTTQVAEVKKSQSGAWLRFWSKVKTGIATLGPFLIILGGILLLFVGIVVILSFIMPWLFGEGKSDDGMNSQFGVSGADFYGVRTVYKDSEQSRIELIENYAGLINDVVLSIESKAVENATLDVTLNAPSGEYDYSNLEDYQLNYAQHYDLIKAIAETVHEYDKLDSEATGTEFSAVLDNIAHFGFSSEMIEPISTKIKDYLNNNGLVLLIPNDSDAESSVADVNTVNTAVDSVITADLSLQTEKYFIKDYLFVEEDDKMSGVVKENYVTWIFMAKNPVTFNYFSFFVNDINDAFTIHIVNGEQEIILNKKEFMTVDGKTTWDYKSSEDLSVSADVYNKGDIDLSSEKSLYEIFNTSTDNTQYVEANDNGIYSYLDDGVRVVFNSEAEFSVVENETLWN